MQSDGELVFDTCSYAAYFLHKKLKIPRKRMMSYIKSYMSRISAQCSEECRHIWVHDDAKCTCFTQLCDVATKTEVFQACDVTTVLPQKGSCWTTSRFTINQPHVHVSTETSHNERKKVYYNHKKIWQKTARGSLVWRPDQSSLLYWGISSSQFPGAS